MRAYDRTGREGGREGKYAEMEARNKEHVCCVGHMNM